MHLNITCADRPRPVYPGLTVDCNADGTLTINATADVAATLAGRKGFGHLKTVQAQLRDLIADAWYAADCPQAAATGETRPAA